MKDSLVAGGVKPLANPRSAPAEVVRSAPVNLSRAARCGSIYAATVLVIRHEAMMGGIGARPKASAIPVPWPLRRMR